jgi:hypothetical protein
MKILWYRVDRKMVLEGWAFPLRNNVFRSLWKPVADAQNAKEHWEHLCGAFQDTCIAKEDSKP